MIPVSILKMFKIYSNYSRMHTGQEGPFLESLLVSEVIKKKGICYILFLHMKAIYIIIHNSKFY